MIPSSPFTIPSGRFMIDPAFPFPASVSYAPSAPLFSLIMDLPFRNDDTARILPWFIACMIFLAALIGAGVVHIHAALEAQWRDAEYSATVHVPAMAGEYEMLAGQTREALASIPEIEAFHLPGRRDVEAQIAPWLGVEEDAAADMLPIPVIAEVKFASDPEYGVDIEVIRGQLTEILPGAELDAHAAWLDRYAVFLRTLIATGYTLLALLAGALAIIIVLATRTGMQIHFPTVRLLYAIGAYDHYIARQFQWHTVAMVWKGMGIGILAVIPALALLAVVTHSIDSALLPALSWHPGHSWALILLFLAMTLLSWFLARWAALRVLRAMP